MRSKKQSILPLLIFALIVIAPQISNHSVAQTNRVKTSFVSDAHLSSAEVDQVVALASKCGLKNIAEVDTFDTLPIAHRCISLKSAERLNGQNVSHDSMSIFHQAWDGIKPDSRPIRVGEFWARKPYIQTTIERKFEINKKSVRIILGDGIGNDFADKVIPLVVAKKVRFPEDQHQRLHIWPSSKSEFERLNLAEPYSINKSRYETEGFEIEFPGQNILQFKFEKGEIIVTGVGHYNI